MISVAAPLKILMLSSEMVPFVKVGGPADVVGALPKALRWLGHDVRVALPCYRAIRADQFGLTTALEALEVPFRQSTQTVAVRETAIGGVPIYFIDEPRFFQRENIYGYTDDGDRFILFCRAVLELCRTLEWQPDVIHAHEWHTAIVPNWLHTIYRDDPFYAGTATVFTIHNLAYQGIFGNRILEVAGLADQQFVLPVISEAGNVVDLMARGIAYADIITTVSETYAREILTPEFGEGLHPLLKHRADRLYGIVNGIDAEALNPATDPYIARNFDSDHLAERAANKLALQEQAGLAPDPDAPVIGMISRLIRQKGCDLLSTIFDQVIALGAQIIVVGTGDSYYHEIFQGLANKYNRRAAAHFSFGSDWLQPLYAGADLYLMPSLVEPCGLNQMIAMRYGAIPIVRATGGLADTVTEYDPHHETGTGFTFRAYDPWPLFGAIARAIQTYRFTERWQGLMRRAMQADHSWRGSAARYVELYERAIDLHAEDIYLAPPPGAPTGEPV